MRHTTDIVVLLLFLVVRAVSSSPIFELFNGDPSLVNNPLANASEDLKIINNNRNSTFIPFARPISFQADNVSVSDNCSSSGQDFPEFFTPEFVENGGFLITMLIGVYCFTLLAVICDKYFLPCVETICEVLNLSPDVAAATFMSIATSCPELFTNVIGTFITHSDIGIGTIVGSSLFNALGVAGIGGLAAVKPLKLDWWPVTRDVILYILSVSLLVFITWDGQIFWYEGLALFIVYFLYFSVMFLNNKISRCVKRLINGKKVDIGDVAPEDQNNIKIVNNRLSGLSYERQRPSIRISAYGTYSEEAHKPGYDLRHEQILMQLEELDKKEATKSLFRMPEGTKWRKAYFFYTWPIQFVLKYTVPNTKLYPKLFPLTFIMCIVWIGGNAYIVSWMITVMGEAFGIPDAILGLTFLAAGGCLPESISMTIISRRGEGSFGVSNSLGANTMNILLSLGLPWFLKTMIQGANNSSFIQIQSGSIEYTILGLIVVAIFLYSTLLVNKFQLSRLSGGILFGAYIVCVILAIVSELLFFPEVLSC